MNIKLKKAKTESDDKFENNLKLQTGGYVVILKNDEEINDNGTSNVNRLPSHLGAFVLGNSETKMIFLI